MSRVFFVGFFALLAWGVLARATQAEGPPIADVTVASSIVGVYEPFVLTCTIGTTAANPYWPYDPAPPAGLPVRTGVSVDAVIRSPAGSVITYPLYLHTPYVYSARTYDHLYPAGPPFWMLRFAPASTGVWRLTLRAEDSSGVATTAPLTFTAVSTSAYPHGFVRVSLSDPRYFAFSDGTPFIGLGHGLGLDKAKPVQDADRLAAMAADGVSLLRVWASSSGGFFSASWPAWVSAIGGDEGYLPRQSLAITPTWGESDVSLKLTYPDGIPCFFQGTWGGQGTWPVSVLPDRVYRVQARVLVRGVTGPRVSGQPYGFVVKTGGWLSSSCADAGTGVVHTPYVHDTGGAWVVVTGTITTRSDQYFLDNLFLALENVTIGEAYVDAVWLEEDLGEGGRYGPNLLHQPDFDYHLTPVDDQRAELWDRVLEKAADADVYLKVVLMEKNDWIYDRITPSGGMTVTASNDNFYAAPGTKARWLARALWRYIAARWGYSTAVHSWELLNEGDPYRGHHYEMAQDFARHMHAADPHMVTTSFWASFPMDEFWANSAYPDLDYADLHAYVSTGWGSYPVIPDTPPAPLYYTDAQDYDGSGWSVALGGQDHVHSANLWSLDVHGDGEWVLRYRLRLREWSGACPYGDPGTLSGPRIIWWMDGAKGNVVPSRLDGRNWRCSTPITPAGWASYDSAHTAEGTAAPLEARILITDDRPHNITVGVQNAYGNSGTAYLDAVTLIAPDGTALPINGAFDLLRRAEHDAALHYDVYSRLLGGGSPAGAGKPLLRGETGLDYGAEAPSTNLSDVQREQADLARDTRGVWLHNLTWAQAGPGGMTDLYYWTANIEAHGLDHIYGAFGRFLAGIPLDNGHYEDARATVPDGLRAWGQADRAHHRGYLWVQNVDHTWRNVVDGVTPPGRAGTIFVPELSSGTYCVSWWDTWAGMAILTQTAYQPLSGVFLTLPRSITDDIAVQWERVASLPGASVMGTGGEGKVYLPVKLRDSDS